MLNWLISYWSSLAMSSSLPVIFPDPIFIMNILYELIYFLNYVWFNVMLLETNYENSILLGDFGSLKWILFFFLRRLTFFFRASDFEVYVIKVLITFKFMLLKQTIRVAIGEDIALLRSIRFWLHSFASCAFNSQHLLKIIHSVHFVVKNKVFEGFKVRKGL